MGDKREQGKDRRLRMDEKIAAQEVGKRIIEAFGYRQIPDIAARLVCDRRDVNSVINGKVMPPAMMLIAISNATGTSIDWLLTGNGPKFARSAQTRDVAAENVTPAMWFAGEERERSPQVL